MNGSQAAFKKKINEIKTFLDKKEDLTSDNVLELVKNFDNIHLKYFNSINNECQKSLNFIIGLVKRYSRTKSLKTLVHIKKNLVYLCNLK